ncbi:MAG: cytochrome c biogenesis CcdA family protein [Dehalococcoidia bacterium]
MSLQAIPRRLSVHRRWALLALLAVVVVGSWLILAPKYTAVSWLPAEDHPKPELTGPELSSITQQLTRQAQSQQFEVSALFATDRYWEALGTTPREAGLNAEDNIILLTFLDIHYGTLPLPDWATISRLRVDGEREYAPLPGSGIVMDSFHHQTAVLQFPRVDTQGQPVVDQDTRSLELVVQGLEGEEDYKMMRWELPIAFDGGAVPATPAFTWFTMLALMAGLLVALSPCLLHMTSFYLTLITGIGMQELEAHRNSLTLRSRVLASALLFVLGFAVVYTIAGAFAGYAGQFLRSSPILEAYIRPITILAGVVVILLGLQVSGLFQLSLLSRLHFPTFHGYSQTRTGYTGSLVMGISFATGCLQCVGGAVFAAMLLYAGVSGSLWQGALTLFLFSLGIGIPYILIASAYTHILPLLRRLRRFVRYISLASAALLVSFGALMLTDNMHLIEDFIFHRLIS